MTMKMVMTMMTMVMLMMLLVSAKTTLTRRGKTTDNHNYHFLGTPPVQNLTSQFQDPPPHFNVEGRPGRRAQFDYSAQVAIQH